jgi:SAM-dependent MidA family methyltransferase
VTLDQPPSIEEIVVSRSRRFGPLPFDEIMELALYHPDQGFYATGGTAGRRGDFITSPEVGPLFGAAMAGALDRWWDELDQPDPYLVVDAGAGPGTLAKGVAAASPRCAPALTYVLVEQSRALRQRHGHDLALTAPQLALPPESEGAERQDRRARPGDGPRFVSLAELPAVALDGVVLANELLDNLPFRLLERCEGGWVEVRITADEAGPRSLREVAVPLSDAVRGQLDPLVPAAPDGSRVPWQSHAADWLRRALGLVRRGRVVVIDYASTTAELGQRRVDEWLRTYRGHERGQGPLDHLGRQDITCEVCVDQLARVRSPDRDRAQAEFLVDLGLDALVAEGRRIWHERAHIGDLEALRARSRIREAEALTDPSGLGAFRVLEWTIG